ncbi:MAG: substrate-binding domain-containing protein [Pseudolabrys sp.]|nr:substrate-binding domain-containing protein [Pseudolabrys sp.]
MRAALIALPAIMGATAVQSAEIKVLSGGAPKEAFKALAPEFEKKTGSKVTIDYAVTSVINDRLGAGEKVDILVLPVPVLDGLEKNGTVTGKRAALGIVGLSVIVRKGAAKPDISTPDKFKAALLSAKSVVHSPTGVTPSGTHLGKMLEKLGIAVDMQKKTTYRPALDGGVQLVARGEAELGIYPASEVIKISDVEVVGSVPEPLTLNTVYGAAVMSKAANPEGATAFIAYISDKAAGAQWRHGGFTPAH